MVFILLHFILNPYLRICLLILDREDGGGEGERERERDREILKHQSVASCMSPDWGSNPQPRYVP